MKKFKKIASFILGIALPVQSLVGVDVMASDSKGTLTITNSYGKSMKFLIDDKEQADFYTQAFSGIDSILKMSSMQLKLKIRVLAKSIIARNLSFDDVNELIDDLFDIDADNDPVFNPFVIATPLLFGRTYPSEGNQNKIKIKTSVKNILECERNSSKKNKQLESILKNDELFTRALYLAFNYINTFADKE